MTTSTFGLLLCWFLLVFYPSGLTCLFGSPSQYKLLAARSFSWKDKLQLSPSPPPLSLPALPIWSQISGQKLVDGKTWVDQNSFYIFKRSEVGDKSFSKWKISDQTFCLSTAGSCFFSAEFIWFFFIFYSLIVFMSFWPSGSGYVVEVRIWICTKISRIRNTGLLAIWLLFLLLICEGFRICSQVAARVLQSTFIWISRKRIKNNYIYIF